MSVMRQDCVDYTALHQRHEVILRVELIRDRLDALAAPRSAKVAEIALGSGDTTKLLAERFDELVCVDLEHNILDEVAAYIAPRTARFIQADALTFQHEHSFDHIFAIGLLEHCPDPVAVLRNIRSLLKPSGRVHILVNNAHSIHRLLGVEIGDIKSLTELSEADVAFGHYRVYTPPELYTHVRAAGLSIEYDDQHYMKPLPSHLMDKLPLQLSSAFVALGRKFPQFAAYTYLEAVKEQPLQPYRPGL